jgi:hypothetical protein
MDVPLKHVIGTVALIGLVIAISLSYTIITSYIEGDVARNKLNQIAEYVSLNLVEMISLTSFANTSDIYAQIKILNLPSDLAGKAYMIQLINATNKNQGCYVQTQLVTRKDLTAKAPIPINSTKTQVKIVTEMEGDLRVRGQTEKRVYPSGMVYGGSREIVVWGLKISLNTTNIGIGLWKSAGG